MKITDDSLTSKTKKKAIDSPDLGDTSAVAVKSSLDQGTSEQQSSKNSNQITNPGDSTTSTTSQVNNQIMTNNVKKYNYEEMIKKLTKGKGENPKVKFFDITGLDEGFYTTIYEIILDMFESKKAVKLECDKLVPSSFVDKFKDIETMVHNVYLKSISRILILFKIANKYKKDKTTQGTNFERILRDHISYFNKDKLEIIPRPTRDGTSDFPDFVFNYKNQKIVMEMKSTLIGGTEYIFDCVAKQKEILELCPNAYHLILVANWNKQKWENGQIKVTLELNFYDPRTDNNNKLRPKIFENKKRTIKNTPKWKWLGKLEDINNLKKVGPKLEKIEFYCKEMSREKAGAIANQLTTIRC